MVPWLRDHDVSTYWPHIVSTAKFTRQMGAQHQQVIREIVHAFRKLPPPPPPLAMLSGYSPVVRDPQRIMAIYV